MAQRSLLVRLLLLPFRPVLRWFTLALVLLVAGAAWTGHLGLGARYLWWRVWPFGPPLVEYAPDDAQALVLVDLTRPDAARLAPLVGSGALRQRLDAVAAALDLNPARDLLQVLRVHPRGDTVPLVVARGRFVPSRIRAALEPRGYTPRGDDGGPLLLVQAASRAAVAVVGRSILLQGGEAEVRAALARAGGAGTSVARSEIWDTWFARLGSRHAALAVRVRPAAQASLGELAGGEGDRLEAVALTLDPAAEQTLRLELVLGPSSPAGLAPLEQRAQGLIRSLQGASETLVPAHLRGLVNSLQVARDEHAVRTTGQATPADLARLARDLEQPGALSTTALALGSALALGGLGQLLGLPAGSGAGVAPLLPAVQGAVQGFLQRLREALPPPAPGASTAVPPSPAPSP